jgi:endonuclease YncB( thermonuclease family)
MEKTIKIVIAITIAMIVIIGFVFMLMRWPLPLQNNYAVESNEQVLLTKESLWCKALENTIVTKVIDGDTVIVEGGYHIRLLGIDADEKNYPCYENAKNRLEELVLNKQITLEKDITDIDKYSRCLRTIFLIGENINLQLVKEGLAVARFYEPDTKYKNEISFAEKQAIENKTGCKWNK